MPIFKRRRQTVVQADPIGAFWSWWSATGAAVVAYLVAFPALRAAHFVVHNLFGIGPPM